MEFANKKGKKVSYFYNSEIGKFYYGKDHPMKPKRVAMAHNLIQQLGLYSQMDVYLARAATDQEMIQFHSKEYIEFLANFISSNVSSILDQIPYSNGTTNFDNKNMTKEEKTYNIYNPKLQQQHKINQVTDCPGFDGLYNFCQMSAGGSIDAAHLIINQETDIAINWGGGLHHAKKQEASGFCYVNDIVLSILELLKFYPRVMYLDIDVHHGDGVEEAFFLTNRVMTVSFHQYGDDFFPGTGDVHSKGEGLGLNHAINVPLKPGITDDQYEQTFKRIMGRVMESFRPDVIILQGGADSIAHDKLGQFNLSTVGRGRCVEFMMQQGKPIIQLGGGGYNVPNVARCWANETSIALGIQQPNDKQIPNTDMYYDQYYPDYKLHVNPKNNFENKNDKDYINNVEITVLEHLKSVESCPGFAFHYIPPSFHIENDFDEDAMELEKQDPNQREDGRSYQIQKASNMPEL